MRRELRISNNNRPVFFQKATRVMVASPICFKLGASPWNNVCKRLLGEKKVNTSNESGSSIWRPDTREMSKMEIRLMKKRIIGKPYGGRTLMVQHLPCRAYLQMHLSHLLVMCPALRPQRGPFGARRRTIKERPTFLKKLVISSSFVIFFLNLRKKT